MRIRVVREGRPKQVVKVFSDKWDWLAEFRSKEDAELFVRMKQGIVDAQAPVFKAKDLMDVIIKSPDGAMIPVPEPDDSVMMFSDGKLYEVGIDPATGKPDAKPAAVFVDDFASWPTEFVGHKINKPLESDPIAEFFKAGPGE